MLSFRRGTDRTSTRMFSRSSLPRPGPRRGVSCDSNGSRGRPCSRLTGQVPRPALHHPRLRSTGRACNQVTRSTFTRQSTPYQ